MWTFKVANSIKEKVKEVATPYIDDLVADVNSVDHFSRSITQEDSQYQPTADNVHKGEQGKQTFSSNDGNTTAFERNGTSTEADQANALFGGDVAQPYYAEHEAANQLFNGYNGDTPQVNDAYSNQHNTFENSAEFPQSSSEGSNGMHMNTVQAEGVPQYRVDSTSSLEANQMPLSTATAAGVPQELFESPGDADMTVSCTEPTNSKLSTQNFSNDEGANSNGIGSGLNNSSSNPHAGHVIATTNDGNAQSIEPSAVESGSRHLFDGASEPYGATSEAQQLFDSASGAGTPAYVDQPDFQNSSGGTQQVFEKTKDDQVLFENSNAPVAMDTSQHAFDDTNGSYDAQPPLQNTDGVYYADNSMFANAPSGTYNTGDNQQLFHNGGESYENGIASEELFMQPEENISRIFAQRQNVSGNNAAQHFNDAQFENNETPQETPTSEYNSSHYTNASQQVFQNGFEAQQPETGNGKQGELDPTNNDDSHILFSGESAQTMTSGEATHQLNAGTFPPEERSQTFYDGTDQVRQPFGETNEDSSGAPGAQASQFVAVHDQAVERYEAGYSSGNHPTQAGLPDYQHGVATGAKSTVIQSAILSQPLEDAGDIPEDEVVDLSPPADSNGSLSVHVLDSPVAALRSSSGGFDDRSGTADPVALANEATGVEITTQDETTSTENGVEAPSMVPGASLTRSDSSPELMEVALDEDDTAGRQSSEEAERYPAAQVPGALAAAAKLGVGLFSAITRRGSEKESQGASFAEDSDCSSDDGWEEHEPATTVFPAMAPQQQSYETGTQPSRFGGESSDSPFTATMRGTYAHLKRLKELSVESAKGLTSQTGPRMEGETPSSQVPPPQQHLNPEYQESNGQSDVNVGNHLNPEYQESNGQSDVNVGKYLNPEYRENNGQSDVNVGNHLNPEYQEDIGQSNGKLGNHLHSKHQESIGQSDEHVDNANMKSKSESTKRLEEWQSELNELKSEEVEAHGIDLKVLKSELNSLISIRYQLDSDIAGILRRATGEPATESLDEEISAHWDFVKMQVGEETKFLDHLRVLRKQGVFAQATVADSEALVQLKAENTALVARLGQLEDEYDQHVGHANDSLTATQTEMEQWREAAQAAEGQVNALNNALAERDSRCQELEAQVAQNGEALRDTTERLQSLSSQNERLEDELRITSSGTGQLENLSTQLQKLKDELNDRDGQLIAQKAEVSRLTSELLNSNSAATQWRDRSNAFETMVNDRQNELNEVTEELSEVKKLLAHSQAELEAERAIHNEEIAKLSHELENKTNVQHFDSAEEAIIERLDQMIQQNCENVDRVLEEFDDMKKSAKEILGEKEIVESKLHQVELEFERSKKRLQFLRENENELKTQKADDELAILKFNASIAELEKTCAEYVDQLRSFDSEWGHCEKDENIATALPSKLQEAKRLAQEARTEVRSDMVEKLSKALRPLEPVLSTEGGAPELNSAQQNPQAIAAQSILAIKALESGKLSLAKCLLLQCESKLGALEHQVQQKSESIARLNQELAKSASSSPVKQPEVASEQVSVTAAGSVVFTISMWALERMECLGWLQSIPECGEAIKLAKAQTKYLEDQLRTVSENGSIDNEVISNWKASVQGLDQIVQEAAKTLTVDQAEMGSETARVNDGRFNSNLTEIFEAAESKLFRSLLEDKKEEEESDLDPIFEDVNKFSERFVHAVQSSHDRVGIETSKRLRGEVDEVLSMTRLMSALIEVELYAPKDQSVSQKSQEEKEVEALDKRMVASMIVKCIEHNCRKDFLQVVSNALEFTEEENTRVGLRGGSSLLDSIIPGWSRNEVRAQHVAASGESFSEAWKDFVMDETS